MKYANKKTCVWELSTPSHACFFMKVHCRQQIGFGIKCAFHMKVVFLGTCSTADSYVTTCGYKKEGSRLCRTWIRH
jgi:hypothetical protein